jgi:1-phosphofructokinase family hexose kinase
LVLTVTLNPLLERRVHKRKQNSEKVDTAETLFAGGKGINVSRQLNHLGIKNHALTFMGGKNGKLLRKILTEENIEFSFISTRSDTRAADILIDENRLEYKTEFEPNPIITKSEAEQFLGKFEKMVRNSSIVVFSGSSPSQEADMIFSAGIEIANELDKICVLDTYGSHLENAISKGPLVLHNNKDEIESSLGIKLNDENDYLNLLIYLNKNNIKLAFVTDGSNNFYASKFGFNYRVSPPRVDAINSTGSGDAFTAGIIYGLEKSMIFDDFVKTAAAFGSANAERWDACNLKKEDFEKYIEKVKIEAIGKKVKLIDDSPNY